MAENLYLGNNVVKEMFYGSTQVKEAYLGNVLIYKFKNTDIDIQEERLFVDTIYERSYGNANDIAIDSEQNVYIARENGVTKIDIHGQNVWEYNRLPNTSSAIALDNEGSIYVASNGANVTKLNSRGSAVWTKNYNTEFANNKINKLINNAKDGVLIVCDDKIRDVNKNGEIKTVLNHPYGEGANISLDLSWSDLFVATSKNGQGNLRRIKNNGLGNTTYDKTMQRNANLTDIKTNIDNQFYLSTEDGEILKMEQSNANEIWYKRVSNSKINSICVNVDIYLVRDDGKLTKLTENEEKIYSAVVSNAKIVKVLIDYERNLYICDSLGNVKKLREKVN